MPKELRHGSHDDPYFAVQWAQAVHALHGRVLDYGCASSMEPGLLADEPAVDEVVAYDVAFDPDYVLRICERFNVSAVKHLDYLDPGSFDGVFTWNVSEHFLSPLVEFRSIFSLLKPGGVWSGRHHPYFSPVDGHHCLLPNTRQSYEEFLRLHPGVSYPHHEAADEFTAAMRKSLTTWTINMMTLYQLRQYAILTGFVVEEWSEIPCSHSPATNNPYISERDAQIAVVQFLFRKP